MCAEFRLFGFADYNNKEFSMKVMYYKWKFVCIVVLCVCVWQKWQQPQSKYYRQKPRINMAQ